MSGWEETPMAADKRPFISDEIQAILDCVERYCDRGWTQFDFGLNNAWRAYLASRESTVPDGE